MSIERVSTILKDADANGYAVAAFNIFNYEAIAWAIEVAEEERIPIIIQFYPGLDRYIGLDTVAAITRSLAGKTSVPIGLHLDHSRTYEQAVSGIRYGFPSIMIDGSTLEFEENIRLTREVVKTAHALGVEVEAELGHVGVGAKLEDYTNPEHFTDPDLCPRFINETGADFLAISIGNAHGHYVSVPNIDFKRLEEINRRIDIPLVLHGGSNIPDDQIREAVKLGINKINIATEYNYTFYQTVKSLINKEPNRDFMLGCLNDAKEEVKEFLRKKVRLLNPRGYRI
ncbi:MAG: tagatose 1,6-diphosphate aldolase GatY/KbaY [Clostridiales bacterium]|nr:tagatose 1,6-diphosphate aldolase GatY/KbaY [Clostridiales bacterium]